MEYAPKFEIVKNDLGLLSIKELGDKNELVISATKPKYQAGLTPQQAQLIASAPDLYEALKAAWANYTATNYDPEISMAVASQIKQALAKAEGKA